MCEAVLAGEEVGVEAIDPNSGDIIGAGELFEPRSEPPARGIMEKEAWELGGRPELRRKTIGLDAGRTCLARLLKGWAWRWGRLLTGVIDLWTS